MKTKCTEVTIGHYWNKKLFDCATCKNLYPLSNNPNENQFQIDCSLTNRAGSKLKKCNFRCKNRSHRSVKKCSLYKNLSLDNFSRIWYGENGGTKQIQNVICRCFLEEDDGLCHWRQGKKETFDLPGAFF